MTIVAYSATTTTTINGHHYPLSYHTHNNNNNKNNNKNKSPIMVPSLFKTRPISLAAISSSSLSPSSSSSSSSSSSLVRDITDNENSSTGFSWNDVFKISQNAAASSSADLTGFFHKISLCNRGLEMRSDFIPFVVEDQIVGYLHYGFLDYLSKFKDVFNLIKDDTYGSQLGHVTLHSVLKTPKSRTEALENVVKCLGEGVIPGIRNELYPVTSSYGGQVYFSLERAAAPYFGIKVHSETKYKLGELFQYVKKKADPFQTTAYGIHLCGYVEKDGEKHLWIGKRSETKPTYPGMLDHLVAGGLPHGISCAENVVKECEEEAGIPSSISSRAIPVGAVSYMDINGYRFKRDVLFCYDLKLPESFIPENQDGEVGSFKLLPATLVADVIRDTEFFKANCNLVIIDFLFRHGYIKPEDSGYLKLLQSLRSGDCS